MKSILITNSLFQTITTPFSLIEVKSVGYRHGEFVDFDINEALAMQKGISDYQWEVCQSLSHNYDKNNK